MQAIIHRYFTKVAVDFTPGPGNFAAVCIANRIAYFGFCFTEEHRQALLRRLTLDTLKAMITEGTPVFDAKAAAFFDAGGSGKPAPKPSPKPPAAAPKPKPSPAKAKGKAKVAAAAGVSDPLAGGPAPTSPPPEAEDPEGEGGLSDWSS